MLPVGLEAKLLKQGFAELLQVMDFAADMGAVGVNVAHSGTLIGILLDARHRRGLSVYKQAQQTFPQAESVHHFRLLAGGVRRVEGKYQRAVAPPGND